MGEPSPALDKLADVFEGVTIETFCEIVGPLFLGVNLVNLNGAITDVAPKEMPLHEEVLGSVGDALFGGEGECTIVVFEDSTADA